MTSFEGIGSRERARLTDAARRLQGKLTVTVHRASHLRCSSLLPGSGRVDVLLSLKAGSRRANTTLWRHGGSHAEWEQSFAFELEPSAAGDGALHLQLLDEGGRSRAEAQLNLAQLLRAGNGAPQWVPLSAPGNVRSKQGFVCITPSFEGTGLEEEEKEQSKERPQSAMADPAVTAPKGEPQDGEQKDKQKEEEKAEPKTEEKESEPKAAAAECAQSRPSTPPRVRPSTSSAQIAPLLTSPSSRPSTAGSILSPSAFPSRTAALSPRPDLPPLGAGYPDPPPQPPVTGYPPSRPGTAVGSRPATAVVFAQQRPQLEEQAAAEEEEDAAFPQQQQQAAQEAQLVTSYDARHEHILHLVAQLPQGRFLCRACDGEGFAAAWHCSQGCADHNLHEECLQPADGAAQEEKDAPLLRVDARHAHPLQWMERGEEVHYTCGGCGGGGVAEVWHCNECRFDLHPECLRPPAL